MSRKKRVLITKRFYHIVCRGNRRDPLFRDDEDYVAFMHILKNVYEKRPFTLASYCLMTNHFHLLLTSADYTNDKIMALINKRYADYYNTKNNLSGHVFEKRYFARLIETEYGILHTSRYIHMNPVEANIVFSPEQYEWSSYSSYRSQMIKINYPFFDRQLLLRFYEGSTKEKMEQYSKYVLSVFHYLNNGTKEH